MGSGRRRMMRTMQSLRRRRSRSWTRTHCALSLSWTTLLKCRGSRAAEAVAHVAPRLLAGVAEHKAVSRLYSFLWGLFVQIAVHDRPECLPTRPPPWSLSCTSDERTILRI